MDQNKYKQTDRGAYANTPYKSQQITYWEMMFRAEYYAWCALRNHALAGNDPVTGISREVLYPTYSRAESKVAYIAMAKYWLRQAAQYRQA